MSLPHHLLQDPSIDKRRSGIVLCILIVSWVICIGYAIWALDALTYKKVLSDPNAIVVYAIASLSLFAIAGFLGWSLLKFAHQAHKILITEDAINIELLFAKSITIPHNKTTKIYKASCMSTQPEFAVVPGYLIKTQVGWFCINAKFDSFELLMERLR